ncbi:MAG: 50S ribosomal protein L4 [Candidatus Hydrogenedentes bacterium]|nr:50S ribosomal protein L4 [Candidatus Hydrogenedentota bacterium]
MASVKKFNMDGGELGSLELNDAVFDVPMNAMMVHDVAVALQNAKRHGTHQTKERGDVRGGGIKPFRQKGTGRARQGSSREPQMKGGGTVFGPHPHSYRQDVPVSFRRRALACVLSDRVRGGALCVLNALTLNAPKTKTIAAMVSKLSPEGRKTLIVTSETQTNVLLSARNLPRVELRTASDLNALDVLGATRVVVLEDALPALEKRLS